MPSDEVLAGEPIGEIESVENYIADSENIVSRPTTTITTPTTEGFWNFNEGWVLAAILIGVDSDDLTKGANLSTIIKFGDFLNHAIFNPEELSSSLTKLLQHGLIICLEKGYRLSGDWRKEMLRSAGGIVPLHPIIQLTKWLNATTVEKTQSTIVEVTKEEWISAYEQYATEIQSE